MVSVTADSPTRHMMSLAPEQQAPANPVSTIPPAMVADELPVASERKPHPNVIPITTRSGRLVKPVPITEICPSRRVGHFKDPCQRSGWMKTQINNKKNC